MTIVINDMGDRLEQFIDGIKEEHIPAMKLEHPLTHALIVAEYEGEFLLIYNRKRQKWEVPGGKIEPGESCRDCAVRELLEETGQAPASLHFNGLMRLTLQRGSTEYGALYSARLTELKPFLPNEEAEEFVLWDGIRELTPLNEIDRKLLDYYELADEA